MFLKEKSPSRRGEKVKAKPRQRDPSRARETRREEPNAARGEAPEPRRSRRPRFEQTRYAMTKDESIGGNDQNDLGINVEGA